MKKPLSNKILTDYLFELLDEHEKSSVESTLKECSESRKKLSQLRTKFGQLRLAEEKPKLSNLKFIPIAAAAIVVFSFIIYNPQALVTQNNSVSVLKPQKLHLNDVDSPVERMIQLETFSKPSESYSLLSKLEAPPVQEFEIEVPEIAISYHEGYEIVSLRQYTSLSLRNNLIDGSLSSQTHNFNLKNKMP